MKHVSECEICRNEVKTDSVVIVVDKGMAYIKEKPCDSKVIIIDKDCKNFRGKPAISVSQKGFIIKDFEQFKYGDQNEK